MSLDVTMSQPTVALAAVWCAVAFAPAKAVLIFRLVQHTFKEALERALTQSRNAMNVKPGRGHDVLSARPHVLLC